MTSYLLVAQIIISVSLVAVLLLQVRGGGLGGIFGQADTVYRTRRGLEKLLFNLTIVLTIVFIAIALIILAVS